MLERRHKEADPGCDHWRPLHVPVIHAGSAGAITSACSGSRFPYNPVKVPVLSHATVLQMPTLFRDMAYLLELDGKILIEE